MMKESKYVKVNAKRIVTMLAAMLITLTAFSGVALLGKVETDRGLRKDFSFNSVSSLQTATENLLKELSQPVHIYALTTPGQEDKGLMALLARYAAKSDRLTYSTHTLMTSPALANKALATLDGQPLPGDGLLVECAQTGRSRYLSGADFVQFGIDMDKGQYVPEGLTYERSLSEAIAYVSMAQTPMIQWLQGHGEPAPEHVSAFSQALTARFYDLKLLNLSQGDNLSVDHPLFLLSPRFDLTEQDLTKIFGFLDSGGRLLMSIEPQSQGQQPYLDQLLARLKLERRQGLVIANKDETKSYFNEPIYLVPTLTDHDAVKDLSSLARTTVIAPAAGTLLISDNKGAAKVDPLLKSGPAYLHTVQTGDSGIEKLPDDPEGLFPLAVAVEELTAQDKPLRAIVFTSLSMFTDPWLMSNTDNPFVLKAFLTFVDDRPGLSLDISARAAMRPVAHVTNKTMVALAFALVPLIVATLGTIVLLSRRNR